METALSILGLSKSFVGNPVLRDVALKVGKGEVVGLLGHNGSGKSTLVKCLAGFHIPDRVERLELYDQPLSPSDLAGGQLGGRLGFVHQDLGLIADLSVAENFQLTGLRGQRRPYLDWRAVRAEVARSLAKYELAIPVDLPVAKLAQADRCLIAVARALCDLERDDSAGAEKLLVLDEPTPFLTASGVQRLFLLMRRFTGAGGSIIFIAHDVDEVMAVTDKIAVLRDGANAAEFVTAEVTKQEVVTAIVGKTLEFHHMQRNARSGFGAVHAIRDLAGDELRGVSFDFAPGQILGVTGLIGSGAALVPEFLAGARRPKSGVLEAFGQKLSLARATVAGQMDLGISLLPDDRLRKSGVGELLLGENIALPALSRFTRMGAVSAGRLLTHVTGVVERSGAIPQQPNMPLGSFSGGNQQKALIAKWLALKPRIFLMSEPTQGVDIGSRQAIYAAIEIAARSGTAIVCYSSDVGELAQICDSVLIISRGRIGAELSGPALTKDNIAAASLGMQSSNAAEALA